MRILGIESSCDDLAAAVLDRQGVRSSVVHSQVALHAPYGGIVPEIASRDHVLQVGAVIQAALEQASTSLLELDGIAVTCGPGLIGSLLCGVEAAKGLALATGKPLIGINHLEGHIAAALLETPAPEAPFLALVVSGGHTSLVRVDGLGGPYSVLGKTRDDAAGEAFDKVAKLLGLGYPGGAVIDRLARGRDAKRFAFPVSMPGRDNLDFSFSGLKTAAARALKELGRVPVEEELGDFCASFQEAIVESLAQKSFRCAAKCGLKRLVLAGGVAANSRLRERVQGRARREGVQVFLPSRANCTDNAAMIAQAGMIRLRRGERDGLDLQCRASWPLSELRTSP